MPSRISSLVSRLVHRRNKQNQQQDQHRQRQEHQQSVTSPKSSQSSSRPASSATYATKSTQSTQSVHSVHRFSLLPPALPTTAALQQLELTLDTPCLSSCLILLILRRATADGIVVGSLDTTNGHPQRRLLSPRCYPRRRASPLPDQSPTSPFVCVPLYIYPDPGAWEPLVEAALAHPTSYFHAIINPYNGPGPTPLPDANYVNALRRLAALPNVTVLGYVHVTYGKRNAAAVEKDIGEYAAWASRDTFRPGDIGEGDATAGESARIRVDGIFFDEAPSDLADLAYMSRLTRCARRLLRGAKSGANGLVMLNPGVAVDARYYDLANYIVGFEQSLTHWDETKQSFLETVGGRSRRQKTVVMMHTCPPSEAGPQSVEPLVEAIRDAGVCGQFLTDQIGGGIRDGPAGGGSMWTTFSLVRM
ncbi:unnamed protein product [Parascedosporium putredinis]|uniref:Uncharacterized protein n=1 Tax=Parascedosporium putredinis TaxID=1442378 RepID=A0A9P1H098_9PEZI|nr:unnamed protein product [Parascedosporium putredinis]CAI7991579.1 unnamed protein product [Parascedosporium putredinis]